MVDPNFTCWHTSSSLLPVNIRIGPPAGIGLNDSDWLAFWAAYLSFVGTVLVSVVSLAQAGYYNVNFSPELH